MQILSSFYSIAKEQFFSRPGSSPGAHIAIFLVSSKGDSFLGFLDLYPFEEYWSVIVYDVPQCVWYFHMIRLKKHTFGSVSYQEIHDVDISYL